MMEKIILSCLLLATNFCVSIICYAETFYLKNGDIVEGTVEEENAKNIKLSRAIIKNPGDNFTLHAYTHYLKKEEIARTEEAGVLSKEFLGKEGEEGRAAYKQSKSSDYYESGLDFAVVGEFEKAEKEFQNVLKVDKFYTPAVESLRLIKDVIKQKISKEIAIRLFKVGTSSDWSSKIKESEEIANLGSGYMMTHTILGIAYLKNKMLDEAMIEFKKAVQMEPDRDIAHNNLGVSYFHNGMLSEATHEFEVALQFNSDLAEAGNNYVFVKMMQKGIELKESDISNYNLIDFECMTSSIFALEGR